MKKILVVLLAIFTADANAAPFCAVFAYGKQCFYYDMSSCQSAAGSQGACIVNQDEVKAPANSPPFCVVSAIGAQCYYYDKSLCESAASAAGGTCAVNPN